MILIYVKIKQNIILVLSLVRIVLVINVKDSCIVQILRMLISFKFIDDFVEIIKYGEIIYRRVDKDLQSRQEEEIVVWIYVCLDEENWGCLGFRVGCSLDLFGNIDDLGVIGGNIILI